MLGWLVLFGMIAVGFLISTFLAHRWGRGAQESMSVTMESESANYVNYGRGPHIGV